MEIDLTKQLQSRLVIRNRIYMIGYEGLEVICFKYGKYGHNQEKCPLSEHGSQVNLEHDRFSGKLPVNKGESREKHNMFSMTGVPVEEAYGTWMKATRTFRPKAHFHETEKRQTPNQSRGGSAVTKEGKKGAGSRYDVLQEEPIFLQKDSGKEANTKKATSLEWRRKEASVITPKGKELSTGVDGANEVDSVLMVVESNAKSSQRGQKLKKGALIVTGEGSINGKGDRFMDGKIENGPRPIFNEQRGNKRELDGTRNGLMVRKNNAGPFFKKRPTKRVHQMVFGSLIKKGPNEITTLQQAQDDTTTSDWALGLERKVKQSQDLMKPDSMTQMDVNLALERDNSSDQVGSLLSMVPNSLGLSQVVEHSKENNYLMENCFEVRGEVGENLARSG